MAASIPNSSFSMYSQQSVGKSLIQKCCDLENILKSSPKDLKSSLPSVLENVFGSGVLQGWGIDGITKSNQHQEFEIARKLLGPEGPLLTWIYSLHHDPFLNFEFPLNNLPVHTRHIIEDGGFPGFLLNKIQFQTYGLPSLVLNAFEYYMFCFAYCLVSPEWQRRNASWSNLADCLYPCLLEDYLNYFMPLDKSHLPSMPHQSPTTSRSHMVHTSILSGGSPGSVTSPRTRSRMGLLRESFVSTQKSPSQGPSVNIHTENETWRSETLIQILSEFWLNQNPLDGFKTGSSSLVQEQFMPTASHVRLARMLVKHIHNFANTASGISSHYQSHLSTLDEFKRAIIPQIVQKKLYGFLKHGFEKWPLDCSFRLVLETWLTYIQPWRYVPSSRTLTTKHDSDPGNKAVDEETWYPFVRDNLLFYTVLFQELLARVLRMDLVTLYNAAMLYRAVKVYNLQNLNRIISRVEKEMYRTNRMVSPHDLGGSYISTADTSVSLQNQIVELERSGFEYKALFGDFISVQLVREILKKTADSLAILNSAEKMEQQPKKSSWLDVSSWFAEEDKSFGDLSMTEVKKLQQYLESVITGLCSIFEISQEDYSATSENQKSFGMMSLNQSSFLSSSMESLLPDHEMMDRGMTLTPLGRYQVFNKLRKFEIGFSGDPMLQPIRSFENATLVRLLHHLCEFVNTQFKDKIDEAYHSQGFKGNIAKIVFKPTLSKDSKCQSPISPSLQEHLKQPRLNLRFLASYKVLAYFAICYVFVRLVWGFSPVTYVVLLLLLYSGYVILRAMLLPTNS